MSETNESSETVAQLKALVAELAVRVTDAGGRSGAAAPAVSEDVLLAISAACAAYLGERAKVKQVHLRRGGAWATQGLATSSSSTPCCTVFGERQAPIDTDSTTRDDMRLATT